MTTEQKIEVLEKDILQRTGRYFTSVRTNGRLGQEDASASGAVYSAAMLSPKDSADLHRMAYGHARDMIVAMNTPFRVRIALTPNASCTDGRVVSVATDMFDNPDLSAAQKIDIFTGLAVHEGSHLLYTDFNMMSRSGNRVVADLFNIIEDERIEMLTGEERPGLAGFLGCVKYYYFDRHSARMRSRSGSIGLSRPARLMNSILAMVRYPKALDMDDAREFADTLYDVREVVLPFPKSCRDVLDAAERIYELIKAFFEKENKSEYNPQQGGKAGSSLDSEVEKALEKVLESLETDVIQEPSDGKTPSSLDDSRMSAEIMKDGNRLGRALEGELEMGSTDMVNIHRPDADRSRYEDPENPTKADSRQVMFNEVKELQAESLQIAHIVDKSIRKKKMQGEEASIVERLMPLGWFRDIYNAAATFYDTVMGDSVDNLILWLKTYAQSPLRELRSFANGIQIVRLRKDEELAGRTLCQFTFVFLDKH